MKPESRVMNLLRRFDLFYYTEGHRGNTELHRDSVALCDSSEIYKTKKAAPGERLYRFNALVLKFLLADPGFLAGKITKIEYSGPPYFSMFVDFNLVNKW